jgi:hypothetical protein
MKYSGRMIDSNLQVMSEFGEIKKLSLLNSENTMFFKYSKLSCNICVEQQMKILKLISQENINTKFILLTNYDDISNLYKFKRINNIELMFYNLKENHMLPFLDSLNIPYYFTLQNNMMINELFVPEKKTPKSYTSIFAWTTI